jgi:hypothetical protein
MSEVKIIHILDRLIADYNKPCLSTIKSLLEGPIKSNNNYYKIIRLFSNDFLKYLENHFCVKATLVKKENPFFFFDTKKGKVSIQLVLKLTNEGAFHVKINENRGVYYKTSKELVEDFRRYI